MGGLLVKKLSFVLTNSADHCRGAGSRDPGENWDQTGPQAWQKVGLNVWMLFFFIIIIYMYFQSLVCVSYGGEGLVALFYMGCEVVEVEVVGILLQKLSPSPPLIVDGGVRLPAPFCLPPSPAFPLAAQLLRFVAF